MIAYTNRAEVPTAVATSRIIHMWFMFIANILCILNHLNSCRVSLLHTFHPYGYLFGPQCTRATIGACRRQHYVEGEAVAVAGEYDIHQ